MSTLSTMLSFTLAALCLLSQVPRPQYLILAEQASSLGNLRQLLNLANILGGRLDMKSLALVLNAPRGPVKLLRVLPWDVGHLHTKSELRDINVSLLKFHVIKLLQIPRLLQDLNQLSL